jgi:hypothetical protein
MDFAYITDVRCHGQHSFHVVPVPVDMRHVVPLIATGTNSAAHQLLKDHALVRYEVHDYIYWDLVCFHQFSLIYSSRHPINEQSRLVCFTRVLDHIYSRNVIHKQALAQGVAKTCDEGIVDFGGIIDNLSEVVAHTEDRVAVMVT